jgi:Uma2 family endonuclease
MSTARKLDLVSVEDYLASELDSPIRREYVDGYVYAMAGGRNSHSRIKMNTTVAVGRRLLGRPCQPFNSDTKIRIRLKRRVRFYYPDLSVVCESNPGHETFQDKPAVLFEVLSRSTRRIDEGEKKDAYLTIPSLGAYVLIEQSRPRVVVYRRSTGFTPEVYEGLDAVLPLPEIEIEVPLSEIYASVQFSPKRGGDEG